MCAVQDLSPRDAAWYFPSVFWLNASDTALQTVPIIVALTGFVMLWGGAATPVAFILAYVCVVSIHEVAIDHYFPWDSLLLESTVLCVFLPSANSMSSIAAAMLEGHTVSRAAWIQAFSVPAAPTPLLQFLFRWLLFRMMWGFGKLKFSACTKKDDT